MLAPKEERRNTKRRELLLLLPVYEEDGNTVLGALGDISTTGVMLFSKMPITTQQTYCMKIRSQDLMHIMHYKTPHEHILLTVESRWRTMVKPELYKTGFQFTDDIEPHTYQVVHDLVRQLWSQRSIGNTFIDITVSIEDVFEEHETQAVGDLVREFPGVIAVSFNPENHRMLTIQYHPEQTSCHELLSSLSAQHIRNRLVRV